MEIANPTGGASPVGAERGTFPVNPEPGARLPIWLQGLGLAGWLTGLLTWALTLTQLTPLLQRRTEHAWTEEVEQYLMWSPDLRVGALVLTSLGLLVLVASRGSALVASGRFRRPGPGGCHRRPRPHARSTRCARTPLCHQGCR
jgi:hypothetical protein